MEKNEKNPKPQTQKPFFARLLETQELEKVVGGVKSGSDNTDKYPSDKDELSFPSEP